MYTIIDVDTQQVLREVAELPVSIGPNEFVMQSEEVVAIESALDAVNLAASSRILEGYTHSNGVLFGLSITDQLNYNSVASMLNMGAANITLFGELNGQKYYSVTMTAAEAAVFFSEIFAYVDSILAGYRDIKKLLLASTEEGISQILIDAGITVV